MERPLNPLRYLDVFEDYLEPSTTFFSLFQDSFYCTLSIIWSQELGTQAPEILDHQVDEPFMMVRMEDQSIPLLVHA